MIRNNQHRIKLSERLVHPPVFRQTDARTEKIAGEFFQLDFEAFQKGKGISHRSGETGQDRILEEFSDFDGVSFDDGITQCYLTISRYGDIFSVSYADDRSGTPVIPLHMATSILISPRHIII